MHLKIKSYPEETIIKSIKLTVKTKDGRMISVPFKPAEIHDLYDIIYMARHEDLELNHVKIDTDKWDYIMHDIVSDGRMVECKDGLWMVGRRRSYITKRPRWIKADKHYIVKSKLSDIPGWKK
jgi:hypothetical protein